MSATLTTMSHGPVTANMIAPGQSMVINGHMVLVGTVDYRLADATIHVLGTEGGTHRDFRLDVAEPVTIL